MTSKSRLLATAVSLVALAGLAAAPSTAEAGKRKGKTQLTPPELSPDQDAVGVVRAKQKKRGGKIIVKLKRLDPKTLYEVRDEETDAVLGQVRTNRRGRATLRIDESELALAKTATDARDDVAVFDEDGECVLRVENDEEREDGEDEGEENEEDGAGEPGYAFEDYGEEDGAHGSVMMLSLPELEMECFSFTFFLPSDDTGEMEVIEFNEYSVDTPMGDDLPLDVETVRDLEGRRFEIREIDGGEVLLDGELPDLRDLEIPFFGGMPGMGGGAMPPMGIPGMGNGDDGMMARPMPLPMPFDIWDDEELDPLYSLWIADGDGTMQKVADLDRFQFPVFDWEDCPDDEEHEDDEEDDEDEGDGEETTRPDPGQFFGLFR